MGDAVEHPDYYGGADNPYEAIKVIEAWDVGFNLGTVLKYIARAGRKDPNKHLEDLKKARFYLDREIRNVSAAAPPNAQPIGQCCVCGRPVLEVIASTDPAGSIISRNFPCDCLAAGVDIYHV